MIKFGIPQVRCNNSECFSEEEQFCIDKAINQLKQYRTVILTGDRCSAYKIAVAVGNKSGPTAYMAMKDTITDTLNSFQMFDLLLTMPETVDNDWNSLQRNWASQKAEAIRDVNMSLIVDWFDCPKEMFEKESSALIARCGRNKNYIFLVPENEGGIACPGGKEELMKAHIERLSDDANRVLHQIFLCGGIVSKELFVKVSDVNTISALVEHGWISSDALCYRVAAPILQYYLSETDFDVDSFAESLWKLSRASDQVLSFADLRTVRVVYEHLVHRRMSGKNCYRLGMLLRDSGYIAPAVFYLNKAVSDLSPDEEEYAEANFYAAIVGSLENPSAMPTDYFRAEAQLWIAYEADVKTEIPCEYAIGTLHSIMGHERAARKIAHLTLREAAGDMVGHYAGSAWVFEDIDEVLAFQFAKEVIYNADRKIHRHSLEAALRVLMQSELSTDEDGLKYAEDLVSMLEEILELPHPKLADAYIDLADRYSLQGHWDEAYSMLLKASAAYTWMLPASSVQLVDLLSKMSYVKACVGDTLESCHYSFRALMGEKKWLSDRECANKYISLAKKYEVLQDFRSAEICYVNALRAFCDMESWDEGAMRSIIIHIYEMMP